MQLGSPSLSLSMGVSELSFGSVPQVCSMVSNQPSLSSSVSALSPVPSASLSAHSEASKGNMSLVSLYPSLSSSSSTQSAIKSPSLSSGIELASVSLVPHESSL